MARAGRRSRTLTLLATALLIDLVVSVTMTSRQASAVAPARVTSVALPSEYTFSAIELDGAQIHLIGTDVPTADAKPPIDAPCVDTPFDGSTLQVGNPSVETCGEIHDGPVEFWPVFSDMYSGSAKVQIARRDPTTGAVSLSPVVMTWSDSSDTHPETIVGDGSLWIFDAATTDGAEVLRIPESTGQVANVVTLPSNTDRPILATDSDGLWMGTAVNGGYAPDLGGSPIYHIAVGANTAQLVFTGGYATYWLSASGHSVWDDIGSFPRRKKGAQPTQTIWRFDGPAARPVSHATTDLPFGVSVVGSATEGLWTVASQPKAGTGPNPDSDSDCTRTPAVLRIDADTGRQKVVATLPAGTVDANGYLCLGQDLTTDQAVVTKGYLYLLDDTRAPGGGFTRLFRIRL